MTPSAFQQFLSTIDPQPWMRDALCAQVGGDAFFPEKGQRDKASAAKAVCLHCDVRVECAQYAIEHDERFGIWGGTTANMRRRRTRPTRVVVLPVAVCVGELV